VVRFRDVLVLDMILDVYECCGRQLVSMYRVKSVNVVTFLYVGLYSTTLYLVILEICSFAL